MICNTAFDIYIYSALHIAVLHPTTPYFTDELQMKSHHFIRIKISSLIMWSLYFERLMDKPTRWGDSLNIRAELLWFKTWIITITSHAQLICSMPRLIMIPTTLIYWCFHEHLGEKSHQRSLKFIDIQHFVQHLSKSYRSSNICS